MHTLAGAVPVAANAGLYAATVLDCAGRRDESQAATLLAVALRNGTPPDEVERLRMNVRDAMAAPTPAGRRYVLTIQELRDRPTPDYRVPPVLPGAVSPSCLLPATHSNRLWRSIWH